MCDLVLVRVEEYANLERVSSRTTSFGNLSLMMMVEMIIY
jgi:hypothetical protein